MKVLLPYPGLDSDPGFSEDRDLDAGGPARHDTRVEGVTEPE